MTPHILMIAPLFPPFRGAVSSRLSSFARHWSKFTKVTVVTPYAEDETVGYNRIIFPLTRWRLEPLRIPYTIPKLLRIVHRLKPDIVLSSIPPVWSLLEGYLLAKRLQIPLVLDVRDLPTSDVRHSRMSIWRKIFRFFSISTAKYLIQKASQIVTVTEYFKKDLYDFLKLPSKDISIIHNGAEIRHFKDKLQVEKKFDIIYSGSFPFIRDQEALLKFFSILIQLYPRLKVCFSSNLNTPLGRHFLTLADKYNLRNHFELIDMCDPEFLPYRLKSAKLGISPLRYGFDPYRGVISAKVFEYLAAGLPVLGLSDPEYYVEEGKLIFDNDAGIVDPDPKELAKKTVILLNNPFRMKEMSKCAKKVGEMFDRGRLASEYYEKVIRPLFK